MPSTRQWGRGQTAAESGLPAPGGKRTAERRQWGRGQTAAERCRAGRPPLHGNPRQWGRGQTAAERRGVPMRLRATAQASMGPRPDGRGKTPSSATLPHSRNASMGPRPDGRGKPPAWDVVPTSTRRQWGRGQTAAESE